MAKEGRGVYVIYVDVLFVINFVMDCFHITAGGQNLQPHCHVVEDITGQRPGSCMGMCYFRFTGLPGVVEAIISYAVISSFMLIVAFKVKNL